MHIEFTSEQRALRESFRSYLEELMTPELRVELVEREAGGPEYMRAMKRLGSDGWLGLGWPEEFGGQGRSPIEEFLFFDELQRVCFPIPVLTLATVGPTLMHYGSPAQQQEYLPAILRGECHFSIGYTEPSAGTDLASLKTRAVKEGDSYVINGQKIWTSLADHADYIWLAARTDPDAPKHKGISIFIVPAKAEGVSIHPIQNLGDSNVNAVFFDNIRVPADNLVGRENGGWKLITNQLNHERVALMGVGLLDQLTRDVRAWAATYPLGGGSFRLDEPWIQMSFARLEAGIEALKLMNWRQAWAIAQGKLQPADASAIKVFGSELYVRGYRTLLQILGVDGSLIRGSSAVPLMGQVERVYRATLVLTFGGGTNEVQRDIIAMAGLRMPRTER